MKSKDPDMYIVNATFELCIHKYNHTSLRTSRFIVSVLFDKHFNLQTHNGSICTRGCYMKEAIILLP